MQNKTPEDFQRQKNLAIIREVLKTDYISFHCEEFIITEKSGGRTHVECTINMSSGETRLVKGSGTGAVDALFNSLIETYSRSNKSLEDIAVQEFHIFVDRADLRQRHRIGRIGADAMVKTCLIINSGVGPMLPFRSQGRSAIRAMLDVVLSTIEFYINSEAAVQNLKKYIKEARTRRRQDLVEKYTSKMVDLVKGVSYERVFREVPDE